MQIQITARQFQASEKLHEYARKKVERLGKFYDGISGIHVIMSKNGHPETHSVEMSAHVHRQQLAAHAEGRTHEEALDECVGRMKRQVVRFKDRLRDTKKDLHR
jgi:ribosome hibernation promoting factor